MTNLTVSIPMPRLAITARSIRADLKVQRAANSNAPRRDLPRPKRRRLKK